MFLTDLLFASPRLRFSEAQKSAILKWAKDLRAPDVPTLSGLKSVRQQIGKLVGNVTEKVASTAGNIFYLNDVGKAIAKVNTIFIEPFEVPYTHRHLELPGLR